MSKAVKEEVVVEEEIVKLPIPVHAEPGLKVMSYNAEHEVLEIYANLSLGIAASIPPKGSIVLDISTFNTIGIPDGFELHITTPLEMYEERVTIFGSLIVLPAGLYENIEIPLINHGLKFKMIEDKALIAVGRIYEHNALDIQMTELREMRG
jgi:hypothetical protein